MKKVLCFSIFFLTATLVSLAQVALEGTITSGNGSIPFATIQLGERFTSSGLDGTFSIPVKDEMPNENGNYSITCSAIGYITASFDIAPNQASTRLVLIERTTELDQAVVTGQMNKTTLRESAVKVEVASKRFIESLPQGSLPQTLHFMNGVQETVACGVCGTNELRINGMEGPYTLVLIDGMPLLSSLSSVYGLNAVPTGMVEQIEVVKGPGSTLYGSEALGGVINIITTQGDELPRARFKTNLSTHGEWQSEAGISLLKKPKWNAWLGGHVQHNQTEIDQNRDGFTDIPLQTQYSAFGKLSWTGKEKHAGNIALRYFNENRAGGQLGLLPEDRGTELRYGEFIDTERIEAIGELREIFSGLRLQYSFSHHNQKSDYGTTNYNAKQNVAFAQSVYEFSAGEHNLLAGAMLRYDQYEDNTPASADVARFTPALFLQDELRWEKTTFLLGARLSKPQDHSAVFSPRINFKYDLGRYTAIRLNAGTGFRQVNLFTEDHAALSGSRQVIIAEALQPERSQSLALNLNHLYQLKSGWYGTLDADAFYTHFDNKIIPDYDSDPNSIVYDNLDGFGVSQGISASVSAKKSNWEMKIAGTRQAVFVEENDLRSTQIYSPDWTALASLSYRIRKWNLQADYNAQATGPMALPTFEHLPELADRSVSFVQHHLQFAWQHPKTDVRLTAGVKNLSNYTQPSPLISAGAPFSEEFDTTYIYGPLQGRRFVFGVEWILK